MAKGRFVEVFHVILAACIGFELEKAAGPESNHVAKRVSGK